MVKKLFPILLLVFLLNACTLPSGEKTFPKKESVKEEKALDTDSAKTLLMQCIESIRANPELRFSFEGYIANNIQKRRITNMYKGVVIGPDQFYAEASLLAQPYKYLQYKNQTYYFNKDKWWRGKENVLVLHPLDGLMEWMPYLDHVVQLKEENILSAPCIPVQITIRGDEWIKKGTNPYFQEIKKSMENHPELDSLLKNTDVTTTLWINKENHLPYQYKTIIKLPVPSAGYIEQEIFFRFIKYNDPGIKVPDIKEIEKSINQ